MVVAIVAVALFARSDGGDSDKAEVQGRTTTRTEPAGSTTLPLATLRAEVDAEVARACQLVLTNGTRVDATTRYNPRWQPVVPGKASLDLEVSQCVLLPTLRAQVTAEVQRACQVVLTTGARVDATTRYDPRWQPVVPGEASLDLEVVKCVQRGLPATVQP